MLLNLKYEVSLSNFGFNSKLRRYSTGSLLEDEAATEDDRLTLFDDE